MFALAARPALAMQSPASGKRSLALSNLHTGEKVKLDYWADGAYEPGALAQISHVLRDHRTGESHAMEPRLLDLLHRVHQEMDSSATFEVISGYRSPVTNAALHQKSSGVAAHSLHMEGIAIDVRLPGRKLTDLRQVALDLRLGGVGLYPTSNFVHMDVGRVRQWKGV